MPNPICQSCGQKFSNAEHTDGKSYCWDCLDGMLAAAKAAVKKLLRDGPHRTCLSCGRKTPLVWNVCAYCDEMLPPLSVSHIKGEIFVASDGEVFDNE